MHNKLKIRNQKIENGTQKIKERTEKFWKKYTHVPTWG